VPLIAGIMQSTNAPSGGEETGIGQFALSASGALVYASGDRYPDRGSSLVRVDRTGAETTIAETPGGFTFLRVSPSGDRFVGAREEAGSRTRDLWRYELPGGTPNRLTSVGDANMPLFSPEGKTLMYTRTGTSSTYTMPADGSGSPQRVSDGAAASWSSNGKWLASVEFVGRVTQIFVRPLHNGKPDTADPRRISPSPYEQRDAEFSPDVRWLAYSETDAGDIEVYVQPFPGPGERHRISFEPRPESCVVSEWPRTVLSRQQARRGASVDGRRRLDSGRLQGRSPASALRRSLCRLESGSELRRDA
jgi:hypothetical protein